MPGGWRGGHLVGQSFGTELERALKPSCFFGVFFRRRGRDDERRDRAGIYRGMSSCKYSGAYLRTFCMPRT